MKITCIAIVAVLLALEVPYALGNCHPSGYPCGFLYSGGTFTAIDYPGKTVTQTEALGINNSGQVVGFYVDPSGPHGFLYEGGQYTALNYPGAPYTYATGINNNGQVVGYYHGLNNSPATGFLYSNGNFVSLDSPYNELFPN